MLAVATAATAALTVGGAAAGTSGRGGSPLASSALLGQATSFSAAAAQEALELRGQEVAERSVQRSRLDSAAATTAADRVTALAALDAVAADRLARFPAADAPTWVAPVDGYTLTSGFGQRWGKLHAGLDLAAPTGTPIRAMGDGEIIEAMYSGGYGQRTIVRHADGTEIWYCHQSAFEVTTGTVHAGDVIGYLGSTGNSTGPHLHLEVHPGGGDPIDPAPWIAALGLTL